MKAQQITYDMCRCYLRDNESLLPTLIYHKLSGYLRAREFQKLASCSDLLLPDVTWGEECWLIVLQVEAMFKKNPAFTDPVLARLAAFISFEEGESLCAETNMRLDDWYSCPENYSAKVQSQVVRMQYFIDKTLGPHLDFLRKVPELIQVTAGATATRSRRESLPFLKISKKLKCTPGADKYLQALSKSFGYGELRTSFVPCNRVEFVPKSWKTERTIACENEGNMFLQLAFDEYCKRSLRKVGIDLSDQTRNQELSRIGSINDGTDRMSYATIDLSMASDTLSYNTVALLLNQEWFNFLRAVRSQFGQMYSLPRIEYHKFSSMGNGATFGLETLVFAAACYSVGSTAYSVYGDDIIIEQNLADELIELLAFLGFVPNTSKSFLTGPVRESCGTHWYRGALITPKYIREIDERKATQCHIVNSMMCIAKPDGELWNWLVEFTTNQNLPLIPYNEDSMSGVWVTAHHAHERKLIRIKTDSKPFRPPTNKSKVRKVLEPGPWECEVKAFCAKTNILRNWDSRSLFLWHLNARRRATFSVPFVSRVRVRGSKHTFTFSEPNESSSTTTASHKYVRKWVHWKPVVGAPEHLY